jgi:4'-phosphopantetheinyl transferase
VAPETLTVTPPDQPPALLTRGNLVPGPIHLHDLNAGPDHVACVAMLGTRLRITEQDGAALLADG